MYLLRAEKPDYSKKKPSSFKRKDDKPKRFGAEKPKRFGTEKPDYAKKKPSLFQRKDDKPKRFETKKPEYSKERSAPFKKQEEKPNFHPVRNSDHSREKSVLFIWGRRIVESYLTQLTTHKQLNAENYVLHIIVDKTKKAPQQLKESYDIAKTLGIKISSHASAEEDWPLGPSDDLNHQRICLRIPEYPVKEINTACKTIENFVKENKNCCVGVVLDQIQDPRNFGAILRSCAFFGVQFVVFATDRQAGITATALKTSAGGAFVLDLIPVTNINRSLQELKDSGAWIVSSSLAPESVNLNELPKDRVFVLVLGNEGKGIRQEVHKNCDFHAKIPGGNPFIDSLNVGVASGIFLNHFQNTPLK